MSLSFNAEGSQVGANPLDSTDYPPNEMIGPPEISKKKSSKAKRARLRRKEKIQRAADVAVSHWKDIECPQDPVLRPLPRPWRLRYQKNGDDSALPPRRSEVVFKAGVMRSAARLRRWTLGLLLYAFGLFRLWISRRNTEENRACLLRETLKKMGPTFIKLGQQLSMRLDLLPYAYTSELEKLLDELDPFPVEEAQLAILRAVGEKKGSNPLPKMEEVFLAFDHEPIGSASVACVYRAILKTGEHVAVKVRRPGIGLQLAADMRALNWLMKILEMMLLPPGFLDHFNHELTTMLMDEMDFRKEARFAELYRRRMRKTKQMSFVSVPRIFFEHSNDEVMVSEFVSGIWLKDILAALATNEMETRALLDKMNVDPVILSRRIQLIARYNNFENIFFHADLHPGNILIQPGNKVCLIDFGSCGSFSRRELSAWRRWFDAQSVDDVGGMVQAALAIIEPLPQIDKDEFGQRLETEFWNNLYAIKSKHSHWSERISSRLWLDFLKLCREFGIPMRLNTLRMLRASLLTDTIAGRLDPDQDPYREFRHYEKGAGKRAKKRFIKRVHNLFGPSKFIRLEQGVESGLQLFFQIQRLVNSLAGIRIGALISKISYFILLVFRHLAWILMVTILFGGAKYLFWNSIHHIADLNDALRAVIRDPWWVILTFLPSVLVLWRMRFRMKEKEYPRGAGALDDN